MDYSQEIENKLAQAQALISECVELADEHGLAFETNFIGATNIYCSKKAIEKHESGEQEIDIYSEYGHYPGLMRSEFCW